MTITDHKISEIDLARRAGYAGGYADGRETRFRDGSGTVDMTDTRCRSGEYGDDQVVDVLVRLYIELGGEQGMRLTAENARRLAPTLLAAADTLDGVAERLSKQAHPARQVNVADLIHKTWCADRDNCGGECVGVPLEVELTQHAGRTLAVSASAGSSTEPTAVQVYQCTDDLAEHGCVWLTLAETRQLIENLQLVLGQIEGVR